MGEKICPVLTAVKKEDIHKCFKEGCAWWDTHYNCCAILSSAVLLEILSKSKKEVRSKTQDE